MASREPRPTEYKGIRFRSKCEAMFARYLELDLQESEHLYSPGNPFWVGNKFGLGRGGFSYEPLLPTKWTPDFLVWKMTDEDLPSLQYEIIEYKPSAPTQTYIDEFVSRSAKLVETFASRQFLAYEFANAKFSIYYGSLWSDRGLIEAHKGRDKWSVSSEEDFDWLINHEASIRETRFDLVESLSM